MNTQAVASSFTIRDRLLADHHRLEGLFEHLLDAFENGAREELSPLWTQFESELNRHMEAEETFLLPTFARSNQTEADAILADHLVIRTGLAELGIGVDLHIVRFATATAFIEHLRAHARRENLLVYRWGDEHLREQERMGLLQAIQAERPLDPS